MIYVDHLGDLANIVQSHIQKPQGCNIHKSFQLGDLVFAQVKGFKSRQIVETIDTLDLILRKVKGLDPEVIEVIDLVD